MSGMNEKLDEAIKWIDLVLGWNANSQIEREAVMTALCNAKSEIRAAKLCRGPFQPTKEKAATEPENSCNRHSDCAKANEEWLSKHPSEKYIPASFHCHNDECEECFGN